LELPDDFSDAIAACRFEVLLIAIGQAMKASG
jgi:hypothetical protein